MQYADCQCSISISKYLFENKKFLFSLKQVKWYWQWHSITWPRRLFLRPESRGLYLVTPPSKQIQHSNFLDLSLLCIQVKFWWNPRHAVIQSLPPAVTFFKLKILQVGFKLAVIFYLEVAGYSWDNIYIFILCDWFMVDGSTK